MPSPAIDNLHRACLCRGKPKKGTTIDARRRMFLCRGSPVRAMATGASADRLQTSHCRCVCRSPTTSDAPPEARTSTRMPKLTLRHFSAGRLRTLPLGPCCCVAARSLNLRAATGAPTAEGAVRSCGRTANGELRLAPALGARAGCSAICPRPEPASFPAPGARGGSRGHSIGGQVSSRAQP
jgi:hypothetical protein